MSVLSPLKRFHLRGCVPVIACAVILGAYSPAHAQLGGLMNKAKKSAESAVKKQTQPATQTADGGTVQFDDVILELNDERVGQILAAFQAAKAVSAGRPALVEKLNKANEEHGEITNKEYEKMQAARNKRSDVETCLHDGYHEAQDRRMKEYAERAMSDPKLIEKYKNLAMQNNAAAAKGDSAAQARLMQGMNEEILPTREDSLNVQKKCGPIPAKLPSEVKVETLEKQIAGYNEEIRQIDEKVRQAQSKQGGMNDQQWGMAIERITMYLGQGLGAKAGSGGKSGGKSGSKSGAGSGSGSSTGAGYTSDRSFTALEYEALEKRLEELKAAFGT